MAKPLKKKFTKARLNIWTGILATVFLGLDYLTGFAIIHFRSLGWLIPNRLLFVAPLAVAFFDIFSFHTSAYFF